MPRRVFVVRGALGVLVIVGVLVGGTAVAGQRAQAALVGSQTGATDAIASCQAGVAGSLEVLQSGTCERQRVRLPSAGSP
jgi:hypothetical protein